MLAKNYEGELYLFYNKSYWSFKANDQNEKDNQSQYRNFAIHFNLPYVDLWNVYHVRIYGRRRTDFGKYCCMKKYSSISDLPSLN